MDYEVPPITNNSEPNIHGDDIVTGNEPSNLPRRVTNEQNLNADTPDPNHNENTMQESEMLVQHNELTDFESAENAKTAEDACSCSPSTFTFI